MLSKTTRPAVSRSLAVTLTAIAGLACSAAHAQTFTEPGDAAGLIPGTPTVGVGALTRINGNLNANTDSDLYAIYIADPGAFSASTVGLSTLDTQLYLFDSTGHGVVACDDVSVSVRQSTIGGQLVTDPGVYYLLITSFNTDPTFNGAIMWNDLPYVGQRAPDGPGRTGTINGYTSEFGFTGGYGIALTGAAFFNDTSFNCPPHMNAAQNSVTGEGPLDIVTGDFDSDGKIDAITCNHISNNASVLMGNGDGTFQSPEHLTVGHGPWGIALGDFNNDGILDFVTANFYASNVTVHLGTGNGNFGFGVHFATGTNPTDVCVADINADGRDDIVVCNNSSGAISVLMGNGAGGFGAAVHYACGGAPTSLTLADVNLDGRLDAVVATGGSIAILPGAAGGAFLAPVNVAGSSSSRAVSVGDMNGDGKPDLVMVSYNTNMLSVFLGNGTTTFQPTMTYEVASGPVAPVIADFNRDGTPDIIIGHGHASITSVFLGTGGGAFEPPFRVTGGGGAEVVVDINSDGAPDIVGARQSTDRVFVITQNPAPQLPGIATQPTSRSVLTGQGADFSLSLLPSQLQQTIRWRRNGVPLVNNTVCSGVTTPALTISGATMADNGAVFDCVITDACGSTTSTPVSLAVSPSCTADFNRDGTVNSQDFFDFLQVFFTGCP